MGGNVASKRRKSRKGRTRAQKADKYALYEKSVQAPEADVALLQRVFKARYGRPPRLLREDFGGTSLLACLWAAEHKENRAWAIDLDPKPLEWGRQHNLSRLKPAQAARVKLIEGNVLDVGHTKVDVTVAFNFSYFTFQTRRELRHYFEKARATLQGEGLLMLDVYGGADSQRTQQENRKVGGFRYVWDQNSFDPISYRVTNFIHFEFKDGSRLRRAFRYDWRLWTLPEIRELLLEAGFRTTEVYWEGTDRETEEANGVFTKRERAPDDPAWVSYVAAWR